MFTVSKRMYESVPVGVKRLIACVPYALLAGKPYRRTRALCQRLERLNREEIAAYQKERLGELLDYATNMVPAYRPYRGVVERLGPLEALKSFPFLTKSQLIEKWGQHVPTCIDKIRHHEGSTGGTSGEQLTFLVDDGSYALEMGYMHSQWARVGYTPRCRKATFRGVNFRTISKTRFWQENPVHNELQFSPFHMTEANMPLYIDRLCRYCPQYLHGYPSAIDALAEFVLREDLVHELPRIRAVLLGSEGCSEMQRNRIERAFRTRAYTWYGHSERVILGGECEEGREYHQFPGYGILEIVNERGNECRPGERGELVGTGLLTRSMPLIRYRTDDHATREEPNCTCGRNWDRFSNVMGRWNIEGLFGRSGNRISAAAVNMHGDLFRNVVRYQYFQEERGKLEIRLMVGPAFTDQQAAFIVAKHREKLWEELDIEARIVEHIPLTAAGKQRRVICSAA